MYFCRKSLFMTRLELFEKYKEKLPFTYTELVGFRDSINQILSDYCSDIKELDHGLYNGFKNDIDIYIDGIKNIFDLSYEGLHSLAFNKFEELMDKYRLSTFLEQNVFTDAILYRMRIVQDRRSVSYRDMFHIPLNKRGLIKTQRYSAPGYPCLYLGTSINACWEELHRPLLENCMVSAFKLTRTVKCIDLSIPKKQDIIENQLKLENYLMAFPLILSCSIKVLNYSDTYKPEYIIPQLLMEYIIKHNRSKQYYSHFIFGVLYASVHINNKFKFSDDEFINWAIPVLDSLSESQYCPVLSKHFEITDPTCEEFERIKTGNLTFMSTKPKSAYEESSFFLLENRLKNTEFFQINQV